MFYHAADTCTHKRHSPLPRLFRCVSSLIWEQFSSIVIFILRSLPSLTMYFPSLGAVYILSKNLLFPWKAHGLMSSSVDFSRELCDQWFCAVPPSCPSIAHCSPVAPDHPPQAVQGFVTLSWHLLALACVWAETLSFSLWEPGAVI